MNIRPTTLGLLLLFVPAGAADFKLIVSPTVSATFDAISIKTADTDANAMLNLFTIPTTLHAAESFDLDPGIQVEVMTNLSDTFSASGVVGYRFNGVKTTNSLLTIDLANDILLGTRLQYNQNPDSAIYAALSYTAHKLNLEENFTNTDDNAFAYDDGELTKAGFKDGKVEYELAALWVGVGTRVFIADYSDYDVSFILEASKRVKYSGKDDLGILATFAEEADVTLEVGGFMASAGLAISKDMSKSNI